MKIVFFTHLTSEFSYLVSHLPGNYPRHEFIFAENKDEYLKALVDSHILIYGNPSISDIEMAVELDLIIVPYAGISQLNFSILEKRKIMVANSHGNAISVAEKALSLALACCGRIVEFHNDQKKGNWHRTGNSRQPFDYWFSLFGKNVTILGTGAIGSSIASLLKGFQCKIKGFRLRSDEIPEHFDSVTTYLEEALKFGDIIFVALPITDKTENIISSENISLLKNKFIVNVGRGQLIEEEPFFQALQQGEIRGAGIDTWYDYPSKSHRKTTGSSLPFSELSNVVLSPHAASHTPEGKSGQLANALEVLEHYLNSGEVLNRIRGDY